jgi:hypothetical protein
MTQITVSEFANAFINKCLKPYASTVPLATDDIIKLHGCKYYLQVDGFSSPIGQCQYVRKVKDLLPFIHPMEFTVGIDS